jgi:hypothetical protein
MVEPARCVEGAKAPMMGLPSVPAKPQGLPFAGVGAAALTRALAKGGRDTRPRPFPAWPVPFRSSGMTETARASNAVDAKREHVDSVE